MPAAAAFVGWLPRGPNTQKGVETSGSVANLPGKMRRRSTYVLRAHVRPEEEESGKPAGGSLFRCGPFSGAISRNLSPQGPRKNLLELALNPHLDRVSGSGPAFLTCRLGSNREFRYFFARAINTTEPRNDFSPLLIITSPKGKDAILPGILVKSINELGKERRYIELAAIYCIIPRTFFPF